MAAELCERLQGAIGDGYRIERELARGGMSRLYLARETALDRPVVVKLLPPELASDVSAARFQREIMVTAQLQHPHVLPVLTAGSRDGLLWYVMPYASGESLRQRLDRERRVALGETLRVLAQLCDAVAYAHRHGVVHRDIKPANVLLIENQAVLADFGVARALERAGPQPDGNGGVAPARLTGAGMALGTPGYMAPEQMLGELTITPRADVYALAAVTCEMLAGRPLFRGAPRVVLAAQLAFDPASLIALDAEVPTPLLEVLGRALAPEPAARYAEAAAFGAAVTAAVAGAPRRTWVPRWVARLGLGVVHEAGRDERR